MITKTISLKEEIGGGSYEIRVDVPYRVDHMFREKLTDFDTAKLCFVREMVIKPKFTEETIQDTGIDIIDALFLTIAKEAHYQIAELLETFDPTLPQDEYQKVALKMQRERFAELQKKVTVR